MTYHELVKKVQTALAKADASKVEGHIAVQVNVTGEAEGAFYIEIVDGVLYVAPYDYNDRDALLTGDGEDVLAVAQGKISLKDAVGEDKLHLEGNYEKILTLSAAIPVKAKKTAAKKTAEKKEEAPAEKSKKTRKAAEKKEEAPAEKPKRGRKPAVKAVETVVETAPAEKAEPVAEAVPAAEPAAAEKPKRGRKTAAKKEEAPAEKPKRGRKSTKK